MGNPEVRQTVIGDHNIFTATGDIRINYHLPPVEAEERRVLGHLADSVKSFWIEGVLKRSLHETAMLELRKEPFSDAVQHPWERILELPERLPEPLEREKRIGEIFSESGRALLILGDPGAGKTVTLLELARELIERFETDPAQPAPVVLNLSTWQDKCRSLSSWIEAELKNKYFVPVRRTRAWLADSRLILLLDGLDEAPAGSQATCARAINEFARNVGVPGIAVCSRRTEYTALPERLSFTAAVCLQPLTAAQIESYLESCGSRLATLRRSILQDPLLQELACSPLMLNVISLAYQDLPAAAIAEQSNQNPESRRVDLFQCYVRRMFQRLGKAPNAYPQERSQRWLSWLACEMRRHSLTVFLLENLQPGWLAVSSQRWAYAISSRIGVALGWMILLWLLLTVATPPPTLQALLAALAFTVLTGIILGTVAGVATGYRLIGTPSWAVKKPYSIFAELCLQAAIMGGVLGLTGLATSVFDPVEQFVLSVAPGPAVLHGWHLGVVTGIRNGLFFGLLFCLKTGWLGADDDIRLSGALRFSFATARKGARSGAAAGAIVGVILVMIIVILQWRQLTTQSSTLVVGLLVVPVACVAGAAMVGLLFAFVATLFSLFSPSDLPTKARPGQGVILSAQSALLAGVAIATCSGILTAICWALARDPDYLRKAVSAAIVWGIAAAIWYGGFDVVQHLTLRIFLRRHDYIPRNYATFLDYTARLIFLQKVGSGYIFVHRQLLDYFAGAQSPEAAARKEFLEVNTPERRAGEGERGPPPNSQLEREPPLGRVEPPRPAKGAPPAKGERKTVLKTRWRGLVILGAAIAVWILIALIFVVLSSSNDQRAKIERVRGDLLMAQGKLPEALDSYRKSSAIMEQGRFLAISTNSWQQDLSVCYEKIGDVLAAQDELPAAFYTYRRELAIDERLTKQSESNAVWQRNLSVCYQKIGAVLTAQGKLPEALDAWRRSLSIRQALANQDQANAGLQTELSALCENVGDVLRAQGKFEEALQLFQQELEIAQRLADKDPTNDNRQRNLGVAWERIGYACQDQNDPAAAAEAFEQEIQIFRQLAGRKPQDAQLTMEYAISKLDICRAYRALGKEQAAIQLREQAKEILLDLRKGEPLYPAQTKILDKAEKEISLLERAGN